MLQLGQKIWKYKFQKEVLKYLKCMMKVLKNIDEELKLLEQYNFMKNLEYKHAKSGHKLE